MKLNIPIILLCLILCFTAGCAQVNSTTTTTLPAGETYPADSSYDDAVGIYVSTAGNDSTGNGSISFSLPPTSPARRLTSRPHPLFPIPRIREERLEVVPLARIGAHGLGKEIRIRLGCRLDRFAPLLP